MFSACHRVMTNLGGKVDPKRGSSLLFWCLPNRSCFSYFVMFTKNNIYIQPHSILRGAWAQALAVFRSPPIAPLGGMYMLQRNLRSLVIHLFWKAYCRRRGRIRPIYNLNGCFTLDLLERTQSYVKCDWSGTGLNYFNWSTRSWTPALVEHRIK